MIDLHTHTLFSDGELLPAELVRRAAAMGHRGIALTDHVDSSNLEFVLPRLLQAARDLNRHHQVRVLAGVEFTHLPPAMFAELVPRARELGAQIIVAHGETLAEPVQPGTNRAALEAGVDILAHPGLISAEEAELAAERGILLEISARKGHCLANGLVAQRALAAGAGLVINTDSHAPGDLIDQEKARRVGLGAGLTPPQVQDCFANSQALLDRAFLPPS